MRDYLKTATQAATIGIFLLLFVAFLDLARTILLPIISGVMVGTMLGPVSTHAARYRIPPWLFALLAVGCLIGLLNLAIVLLSGPITEWIGKAPEIAAMVRERLQVLDRPLAALRDLQTVVSGGKDDAALKIDLASFIQSTLAFLTPALGELVLFFASLFFFLMARPELRKNLIFLHGDRDERLRTLRVLNDIEENLTQYLGTVSVINIAVGLLTGIAVHLTGYPNAILWGALAFLFNYLPYVGPAVMILVLFIVGLVIFPSPVHAVIAPLFFATLATIEGHFVTPKIVGLRLTLNPLAVFLALAFWTWLWGPVGAFLAVPLLIIGVLVVSHRFFEEEGTLPG